MGPAGDNFLIVTETKDLFKFPLIALTPTELTISTDIEPLSLNGSPFNFTTSSLWLTGSETSLILYSEDGTFYEITFEGNGANYTNCPLEGTLAVPVKVLLPSYTDNSAHILLSRPSEDGAFVGTDKRRLVLNQTNGQIEIRY